MLTIINDTNNHRITIEENGELLQVQRKIGRRIRKLISEQTSLFGKCKQRKRRKNSNCFLTANYVGFGITKGLGKLKQILTGKYKIPDVIVEDSEVFYHPHDAEKNFGFPFYGVVINPDQKKLHAFIVVGCLNGQYICFHQKCDGGKYEFIKLGEIMRDWNKSRYHVGFGSRNYADQYKFIKI